MSRLIDADALKKDLDAWVRVINKPKYYVREEALYIIDAMPMVEPKRGKWVQKKTAIGKTYSVYSRCKTDFKFKTDRGTLVKLDMDCMSFCPNCGAKMEGKP